MKHAITTLAGLTLILGTVVCAQAAVPPEPALLADGVSLDDRAIVFNERVPDEDYQAWVASLPPARIDPAFVDKSPLPPWGLDVLEVTPESPASLLGLQPGAVIVTCNGIPQWEHHIGLLPKAPDDPTRKIEVILPDGRKINCGLPPGKIGITTGDHVAPEKYLLGLLPRGPWDADMLIASIAWERGRHDVTETAIAKALAKRMPPNQFSCYFGSLLAMERGDDATARKFLTLLRKPAAADEPLPRFFWKGLATLAFQYHDVALLKRVVAQEAMLPAKIQPSDIDLWNLGKCDLSKPLLAEARKRAGKNLMPEIINFTSPVFERLKLQDSGPLRGGTYTQVAALNRINHVYFGPQQPLRNMIWEMRVAFGDTAPPGSGPFPHNLASDFILFQILHRDLKTSALKPERELSIGSRVAVIGFGEKPGGERWTRLSGSCIRENLYNQRLVPFLDEKQVDQIRSIHGPAAKAKPMPPGVKATRLSLVRRDNEVEISIDDQPVLRMPIDPNVGDVGCYIQLVGITVAIEDMTLREILKPE